MEMNGVKIAGLWFNGEDVSRVTMHGKLVYSWITNYIYVVAATGDAAYVQYIKDGAGSATPTTVTSPTTQQQVTIDGMWTAPTTQWRGPTLVLRLDGSVPSNFFSKVRIWGRRHNGSSAIETTHLVSTAEYSPNGDFWTNFIWDIPDHHRFEADIQYQMRFD